MTLRFLAIDPATGGDHCPAVFVDDDTGDLLFQGWAVTDSGTLAETAANSPLGADEAVIRLPARMREIVKEAMDAARPSVQ